MDAIKFPEVNLELGKGQPQYVTLPVCYNPNDEGAPVTCCFQLSKEELEEINRTGKLWHTQLTFGNLFHPIRMSTQNPFINLN